MDKLEMLERPELVDQMEPKDLRVALDRLEVKEPLDLQEMLGLRDNPAIREQQVQPAPLVLKVRPVPVETLGHPVLLEHRAQQVQVDSQVLQAHRELKDHKVPLALSDPAEHPEQTDPMDRQVSKARPVFPVHRDFPELPGNRGSREEQVSRVVQAHLEHRDQPVRLAILVRLATMVLQDPPGHRDLMDFQEPKDCPELLVPLDLKDLQDFPVLTGNKDRWEIAEVQATQVPLAFRELSVPQDQPVRLV